MEIGKPPKATENSALRIRDEAPQLALVKASLYSLPPVKESSFASILSELVAYKWVVLGAMVAGLVGSFAYTLVQTPLYESHASVEVQPDGPDNNPSTSERRPSAEASARKEDAGSNLETQVRILQSRAIVERALNHLPETERQKLVERSRLGSAVDRIDAVEKRLTITPSTQAHIIDIEFLSPDAQAAADFVNILAQELSDYGLERQWKAAQRSGDWLQPQLNEVRSKLEQSEKALDEYARGGGVMIPTDGSELEAQWVTAHNDLVAKQLLYERLRTSPPGKLAEASGDAQLKDLQRQSDALQTQMAANAKSPNAVGDGQPTALKAQWHEVQQSIEFRQSTLMDQSKGDYLEAVAQEKSLSAQLGPKRVAAMEAAAKVAPEKTSRYAILKQEAEANRQLYESLTTRVTEAGIVNSLKTRTVLLLDSAYPARQSSTPNTPFDLATGLAAGTLAGVAFVLVRKITSPTFSQPGTLSRVLSLPELGAVPQPETGAARLRSTSTAGEGIVPLMGTDDVAQSESYRAIRSSLLYQSGDSLLRCLVFTSATAGEGKTTVVTNLSMSLAATNRRVLIIDGDMRRPKLHKTFGVSPSPGLSDLLRRQRSLGTGGESKFIVPTAVPNLFLLPCGTAGGDAPELLAGDRLPQLLKELRKSFDLVIVDTPPLLPCADARSFAKSADGAVLVVRANETGRREAGVARDTLLQDGSQVIGTVLTGFHARRNAYGYSGYSTTV